jgi:hypothetical protein
MAAWSLQCGSEPYLLAEPHILKPSSVARAVHCSCSWDWKLETLRAHDERWTRPLNSFPKEIWEISNFSILNWSDQPSCCESFILVSVFNLDLDSSSFSMLRCPTRHLGKTLMRQSTLMSTIFTRKTQMSKHNEQKVKKKIHTVRPAGLKTRRSFSYTIITKKSCFWLSCCSLHNSKWIIGD